MGVRADSLAFRGPNANETCLCNWWGRLIARKGANGLKPGESSGRPRTPRHHAEA